MLSLPYTDVLVSAVAGLPPGPLLKRGSTITLICNVTVTTTGPAQVQVQWLQRPIPRPLIQKGQSSPSELLPPVEEKPRLVAALSYEGLTRIYSNDSEVSIDRLSAAMYRLRVHTATADDQGLYTCQAEVFGRDPHGGWYNTKAKAQSPEVTVYLYAQSECLRLLYSSKLSRPLFETGYYYRHALISCFPCFKCVLKVILRRFYKIWFSRKLHLN